MPEGPIEWMAAAAHLGQIHRCFCACPARPPIRTRHIGHYGMSVPSDCRWSFWVCWWMPCSGWGLGRTLTRRQVEAAGEVTYTQVDAAVHGGCQGLCAL
eukprot:655531-Pelagomonas_calceolata.AAC.8